MRARQQAGDTIVEVLIAIAIVSLVLSGAFAATRNSQLTTQRNEERSSATKLLETQAERLKLLANDAGSDVYAFPGLMCIRDDLTVANDFCDDVDGRYDVQIERHTGNTFEIRVQWERLGGEGGGGDIENVVTYYRVHPES